MGHSDIPVETLLLRRWNPRSFTKDAVSDADLASIFTAAAWGPRRTTNSLGGSLLDVKVMRHSDSLRDLREEDLYDDR